MDAVIIDLDGTLINTRRSYEFIDESGEPNMTAWLESTQFSPANFWCQQLVYAMYSSGISIIFLTAREGTSKAKKITEQWLQNFGFAHIPYKLIMRDEGDLRQDPEVKRDIYNRQIAPYYSVLFAVDDKSRVIDMWRDIGVVALHCADY